MTASDRRQVLAFVAEAVGCGSRQRMACEMVEVAERTLQRWQLPQMAEDGRRGPRTAPHNTLSQGERAQMVAMAAHPEFCHASPHQMVPCLADRGEYLASESSFYRVLQAEHLRAHHGRATPSHRGTAARRRRHGAADTVQVGHHVGAEFPSPGFSAAC